MAKTTGPLLSMGARGSLGKTLVASVWRGVPYMRQHVVPTNPNTVAQQRVRGCFALLREMWKNAPAEVIDSWNAFAQGRKFLGLNKWVGENVRVLNNEVDMNNIIWSPGAKGGPAPTSFVAVTGAGAAGTVATTFVYPTAPTGWSVNSIVVAGCNDQNPTDFFTGPFVAAQAAAPATTLSLGGLGAGEDCQVGGWLVWNKPDGSLAYSVSLNVQVTSHA